MLAPYLEGDKPTHTNQKDSTREWNLVCPLHSDQKRSASLNIDKGVFYCFVCGGMPVTALIRRQNEWLPLNGRRNGNQPDLNANAPSKPARTLTEGMIAGWHSALMSNTGGLQWLLERRGLTKQTVANYEIGMDNGKIYTIPVRSPETEIWNVRYYNPNPGAAKRKIWSEAGYGSPPRLYPISILDADPDEIIILGGEWDTLLTIQNGFYAITRTSTEDSWEATWGELFAGKKVYLGHDKDAKGRKANGVVGRALERACDVYVLDWPYDYQEKHGKDATDFFLDHTADDFRALLADAKKFGKRARKDEAAETVTVLDSFDAKKVGKPLRVVVTIKGRKEPGYVVPERVHFTCTQDAGTKCNTCPLMAASGDTVVDIPPDDPLILGIIDHPDSEKHRLIATAYGVPGGRCTKLHQEIESHQAVEVLFARPSLDHSDGTRAGDYKNIRITSVGRHDTPANYTVAAYGALHPNPRTQSNEFLAHQIERLETTLDKFEISKETLRLLTRFKAGKVPPLKKLAEICRELSEHVTFIHGRPELHALIDLVFHSPLSFDFGGEHVSKGWLEGLVVGDTRTGKSAAAERLVRHYRAGEVVGGETASLAGLVGGLQQLGGRDWAVTWGVIPLNDRRIVVVDELSGLHPEDIARMSDVRASGVARLTKIQQEVTHARTRLLWLGNPRSGGMDQYTYGVDALRPLIGNPEDIARFDVAMALSLGDVPAEIINTPRERGEPKYTSDACNAMLMWAWTRTPDQITWEKGTEAKVFRLANELGKVYVENPPLVQAANIRVKIARIAAALAARTFSVGADPEILVIGPQHVDGAVQFLNLIYGMTSFGYLERSREWLEDQEFAKKNKRKIAKYLATRPTLAKFLRTSGKFRRQDVEEILDMNREEANGVIRTLYEARMVRKVLGDIVVEPTLHALLREGHWQ